MGYLFSYKIFENVQQAKSILKRLNIPEKDKRYLDLRTMLKDHLGYLGWFTKMSYECGISYNELSALFNNIINNPAVIQNLPKSVIQYDNYEKLIDDYIRAEQEVNAKRIWNEFPADQKGFFRINWERPTTENKKLFELLNRLYKLKDRNNFIRKISRYKTKSELVEALKNFVKGVRGTTFPTILKQVQNSGASIVHQDPNNDIIVCQVDYNQINDLGSNSSWCIVRSKGTFDSYADGINLQYIVFLTDETGNKSKIGVTYGLKYRTAHLLNDTHIGEGALTELLRNHDFNLSSLARTKEELFKDPIIRKSSVSDLVRYGLELEDIMKNKKTFTTQDIKNIPQEYVDRYNLLDKIAIDKYAMEKIKDMDYLMKNRHRLVDKIGTEVLLKLSPSPNQLPTLMEEDLLDNYAKKWFGLLIKCKKEGTILDNMWMFSSTRHLDHRDREEEKESFDGILYALKYCGISSFTHDLEDLLKISNTLSGFWHYKVKDYKKFLIGAGFELTDPELCFKIFKPLMRGSTFTTTLGCWLDELDEIPVVEPKVRELLTTTYPNAHDISDAELAVIKAYFPDLHTDISNRVKLHRAFKAFDNQLPNTRYQNYGLTRTPRPPKPRDNPNFRELYNTYWKQLKMWKGWTAVHYDVSNAIYMINILCKLGKYSEISEMNLHWSQEFLGKLIRSALDHVAEGMYTHNGETIIHDDYKLTEGERRKLFEWLLTNVKVSKKYSNVEEDIELSRHHVFSLVYYLYDWGFDKYLDLVKRTKNNYHEQGKYTTCRIKLLDHVLSYLAKSNRWNEFKDLVEEVLSWKMSAGELKETVHTLRHGLQLYDSSIFKKKEEVLASLSTPIKPEVKSRNSEW